MNQLIKIALILLTGATVSRMVQKKNHEITVRYRLELSEDEINHWKEKFY